jgi:poly-beta-1,6-N-acetyl-D-glucosamine synthase
VSTGSALALLLAFVGCYPVVTAAIWVAGGLLYRVFDEPIQAGPPPGGWPGVTILMPAYNEGQVITGCVQAARAVDYPELEVLVLDDGSTDDTVAAAAAAAGDDARVEVVQDPVNRGKSDRLNLGFQRARHELVVVTDADTHLHPLAIKLLVARLCRSPLVAAVAGAPHVTNRHNLLCAMQMIEVASIIGLIRRTQALADVSVVAGVLGLFGRDPVLAVGGYRAEMATEDIDLSFRLLLAGWHTSYEPNALVGMEVPSTVRALWAQRRRWARGQAKCCTCTCANSRDGVSGASGCSHWRDSPPSRGSSCWSWSRRSSWRSCSSRAWTSRASTGSCWALPGQSRCPSWRRCSSRSRCGSTFRTTGSRRSASCSDRSIRSPIG